MPYSLPSFPLQANLWRSSGPGLTLPKTTPPDLAGVPCQLWLGRTAAVAGGAALTFSPTLLLVPRGTDLRGPGGGFFADVLEVPAGTGRYYIIKWVEDRSKGFPNEHRAALLQQEANVTGGWPRPTP